MATDLFIRQLTEHLPADSAAAKLLRFIFDDGTGTVDGSPTAVAKQNTIGAVLDLIYALRGPVADSNLTMPTARILGRISASTGAVENIEIGDGLTLAAGALALTEPSFYQKGITGLTGGGASKLDGITGAVVGQAHLFFINNGTYDEQHIWRLYADTSAAPGCIPPVDYDAGDPKVWKRMS